MALHDEIYKEILRGNLKEKFYPKDVIGLNRDGDYCIVGEERYSIIAVRTIFANSRISRDGKD